MSDDELTALVQAAFPVNRIPSEVGAVPVGDAHIVLLRYCREALRPNADPESRERTAALARHLAAGNQGIPIIYSSESVSPEKP